MYKLKNDNLTRGGEAFLLRKVLTLRSALLLSVYRRAGNPLPLSIRVEQVIRRLSHIHLVFVEGHTDAAIIDPIIVNTHVHHLHLLRLRLLHRLCGHERLEGRGREGHAVAIVEISDIARGVTGFHLADLLLQLHLELELSWIVGVILTNQVRVLLKHCELLVG